MQEMSDLKLSHTKELDILKTEIKDLKSKYDSH